MHYHSWEESFATPPGSESSGSLPPSVERRCIVFFNGICVNRRLYFACSSGCKAIGTYSVIYELV